MPKIFLSLLLTAGCTAVDQGTVVDGKCIERVIKIGGSGYSHEVKHFKMGCLKLYEEQRTQVRNECRAKHPQSDVEFKACLSTALLPAFIK